MSISVDEIDQNNHFALCSEYQNYEILKNNFKSYKNFEKRFYPLIIKRYKCGFHNIDGFWSSVDNQKDLELLNSKNNKFNYRNVEKLRKYLINYVNYVMKN